MTAEPAVSRPRAGTLATDGYTARHLSVLEGLEARRVLHAGEGLRVSDVRHPVLVNKGATVTMTFAAPGIELTAVGRAMSEGGLGETVVVQNPVSFRQVSAVVTGAGEVRAVASGASLTTQ